MKSKLLIVVLGMMGRCPFGGQTWLYLNWLAGLKKLGHDVWYVEDDIVWPFSPRLNEFTNDPSYAIDHTARMMAAAGLPENWAFRFYEHTASGKPGIVPDELYQACDLLLNIVGATELREEHMLAKTRVYVETDPVTLQLRLASGDKVWNPLEYHQHVFTYGENYGASDCGVPLGSTTYLTTRQPIDLDLWPYTYDPGAKHFTTIGNYRQDGADVTLNGQTYHWSKHHEWRKFISIAGSTSQSLELALKIDRQEDRDELENAGWRVVSPYTMSLDPLGEYRSYIQSSRAEFTVAKDQNVRLRSGWFSERDACYLASGKPVVAQDTGFSKYIPTGAGLFSFTDIDEALSAIDMINGNYEYHCRAAREIASEHFEAGTVAARLLDAVGA